MGKFLKQSICCILGAGYSHVAGAPLTRDLFAIRNVAIPSEAASTQVPDSLERLRGVAT